MLEHGQIVGRLVCKRMAEVPQRLSGRALDSDDRGQGLRLSRYFRQD